MKIRNTPRGVTQFSCLLSAVFVLLFAAACSSGTSGSKEPKTITVSSVSELELYIATAIPGDTIIVQDGVYAVNDIANDGEKHIYINGRNLAPPGLVIKSESLLGVTLQGENAIRIYNSSHITFSGFKLHQNTILAWDQDGTPLSPYPGGGVVKHVGVEIIDSDHITFERNHFDISEDVNFEQNWIIVDEKENELDEINHSTKDVRIAYNYFSEKTTSRGNFITVKGIDGEPLGMKNDDAFESSRTIAQRTYIGYNHFDGFSITDGSGNNEAIRLGRGAVQEQFAYTIFEYNLLERWNPNGDTEIITVKSSGNILRYNTFKDSRGRVTNRSGDFNIYEGNFFSNIECPIRLIGNNHIVLGNYAEKSEANFMVLSSGKDDDSGGYDVAENCIIAFNTVIDRGSINRANRDGTDPRNNVISHNIFYEAGSVLGPNINSTTGTGNILFKTAPGRLPADSYQTLDPKMVRDANNIYRLDPASPVPGGLSPTEVVFYQSLGSQPGYEHYTAVSGLAGYNVGGGQIGFYKQLKQKDVGPYAKSIEK